MPVRVSVPPETVIPPVPEATPSKVVLPAVMVSVRAPSTAEPLPDNVVIEAPDVVPEMSNTPLSATPDEVAIAPVPVSDKVAPELIVVSPV